MVSAYSFIKNNFLCLCIYFSALIFKCVAVSLEEACQALVRKRVMQV